MGSFHFTNLAFVWHSPAAIQALAQILRPSWPFASVVNWREMSVYHQFDRDLLCVETKNIVPRPGAVDAVNAVDMCALSAAFARESEREIAATLAEYGPDGVKGDEAQDYAWEVSSLDYCLAWLAEQVGAPVSYWHHFGDHGLNIEEFTGYGPAPAAWRNRAESQGSDWDNSRPRSALTAALWHVGFQARNFDECQAVGADTLAALYGEPTDILHIKRSTPPARSTVRLPKFLIRENDPNELTE